MASLQRQEPAAAPIVKWVGGKTRLLPELLQRVPREFARYYEPFAGGAALFFALAPSDAVLGDANADLVATYREVARDVETVIERLLEHAAAHSSEHYYRIRNSFNARTIPRPERAAAFLYLNRACFNGLWRVNKYGAHNVGFGKAPEVRFDADNLRAAALQLARADLRAGDYRSTLQDAREGDLVYLDPPYDDTFNGYTSAAFDQRELARCVSGLLERGCHVLVSNSETPLIRELYASARIEVVRCPRAVNADGKGRGEVDELLITGLPFTRLVVPTPAQPGLFDGVTP